MIETEQKHSIQEILRKLKIPYTRTGVGTRDTFRAILPLALMKKGNLVFCNKPDSTIPALLNGAFDVIVLLESTWGIKNLKKIKNSNASIFLVENPRLVACHVLTWMYPDEDYWTEGIHVTALIHPEAAIHPSVLIGPHAIIGRCVIRKNSRIGAFTVINDGAVLGDNVIVREFCHIGGCGFGMVRDEKTKKLTRFPHVGKVIIEDNVELFPYVNVDRGALGHTLIKRGTKVDHYSHIGHNCTVGENTVITARTVMCGGSSIGANSWAGVGSIIKEKVAVGNDVTIGLGAVVTKDVKDGKVVAGVPARLLKRRGT